MDFEFETKRTALENAFAAAGADWLGYMGMTDTVVADIPGTSPQKYAVAGTLNGILSMAGKMMGDDGTEQPTGDLPPKPYTNYNGYSDGSEPLWTAGQMEDYARAAIAAHLARQAPAVPVTEQQVADLLFEGDIVTKLGYVALINGDTIYASLSLLTRFVNKVLAEVAPAGAQVPDDLLNVVRMAASSVLHSHRINHLLDEDDQPYPLVDLLSKDAPDTIATGKAEADEIAEAICDEFRAIGKAFLPTPAGAQNAEAIRNQALEDVAKLIDKKVDSYCREHGSYDHTTGVTEYPGDGAEWVCEMEELAEEIRALQTGSANTQEGGAA